MVTILIGNSTSKIAGFIPDHVNDEIYKELSYIPPGMEFSQKVKDGVWDGVIRLYYKNRGQTFYSGLASIVGEILKKHQIQYKVIDSRVQPPQDLPNLKFTPPSWHEEREYQDFTIKRAIDKTRGILQLATGAGKCLGRGTPVMMFDGSIKPVESIVNGDLLMGPDSTPRSVISTTKGYGNLYNVKQKNGDGFVCNDAHILCLWQTTSPKRSANYKNGKYAANGNYVEVTAEDYFRSTKTFKHYHKGYKVGVEFNEQKLTIDPYFLGLWLGDGNSNFPAITSGDKEIKEYLCKYAKKEHLLITEQEGHGCKTYFLINKHNTKNNSGCFVEDCNEGVYCGGMCAKHYKVKVHTEGFKAGRRINPLLNKLRDINVINNKHIPSCYKYNSRVQRLQLMAGLIDSDGNFSRTGSVEFCNTNEKLAEDVCWLARSLGFRASINHKKTSIKKINYVGMAYRVIISGKISEIPILLNRKQAGDKTKYSALRYGISVQPHGKGEYFGFEIDGDRKFLLGDFTVTHNTMIISELIGKIKTSPFIFYVLSKDLMKQAYENLSLCLNEPIGRVGGGNFDIQKINVVMVQTAVRAINRNNKNFKISDYVYDDEDKSSWDEDQLDGEEKLTQIQRLITSAKGIYVDECITGDSKIITELGEITILEAINKKCKMVLSHDGTNTVFKPILNRWVKGKKKILIIKLNNGEQIKCTPEHLIMTNRGWIQARYLTNMDYTLSLKENKEKQLNKENEMLMNGVKYTNNSCTLCHYASADVGNKYRQAVKHWINLLKIKDAEDFTHLFKDMTSNQSIANIILNQQQKNVKPYLEHCSEILHYCLLMGDQKTTDCKQIMGDVKKNGRHTNQILYRDMELQSNNQIVLGTERTKAKQLLNCALCVCHVCQKLQKKYMTENKKELQEKYWIKSEILGLLGGLAMTGIETQDAKTCTFTQKDIQKKKIPLLNHGLTERVSHVQSISIKNAKNGLFSSQLNRQEYCPKKYQNTFQNACSTKLVKIESVNSDVDQDVFDIEVQDTHCFFANGILVHNCHHAASKLVIDVMGASPNAFWRFGGSATPYREDNAEIVLQGLFGKKIVDISASYLIKKGYLVKPYIFFVPVEDNIKMHSYKSIYKNCIVDNKEFNQYVASTAHHLNNNNLTTLILVQQYAHGDHLLTYLPGSKFITARMSTKDRDDSIDSIRKRERMCVIASSLADEGLDIRSLNSALLAGGGASCTRIHQRVGRTLRVDRQNPKSYSIVVIYVHKAKYLIDHAKKVKNILKTEEEFELIESQGLAFVNSEISSLINQKSQSTIFDV